MTVDPGHLEISFICALQVLLGWSGVRVIWVGVIWVQYGVKVDSVLSIGFYDMGFEQIRIIMKIHEYLFKIFPFSYILKISELHCILGEVRLCENSNYLIIAQIMEINVIII